MVGLIPLFAVESLDPELVRPVPGICSAAALVPRLPAGSRASGLALARAGRRRTRDCCHCCVVIG